MFSDINLWLFLLTFVFGIAFDWIATLGWFAVQRREPWRACLITIILELLAGYFVKIISIEGFYVIPSALGAGVGTYFAVRAAAREENRD
jgi:hypothetical protein